MEISAVESLRETLLQSCIYIFRNDRLQLWGNAEEWLLCTTTERQSRKCWQGHLDYTLNYQQASVSLASCNGGMCSRRDNCRRFKNNLRRWFCLNNLRRCWRTTSEDSGKTICLQQKTIQTKNDARSIGFLRRELSKLHIDSLPQIVHDAVQWFIGFIHPLVNYLPENLFIICGTVKIRG